MSSNYAIPEPLDQWGRKPLGIIVTVDGDEQPFYSPLPGHEHLTSKIEARRSRELIQDTHGRLANLFNWFSDLDDELLGIVVSGWVGRELAVHRNETPPFWWPAQMECPPNKWPLSPDDIRCLAAAVVASRSSKQEFDKLKAVADGQAIFMIGVPTQTFYQSLTTILEVAESMHCQMFSRIVQGEGLFYTKDRWRRAQTRPITTSPAAIPGTMVLAHGSDTESDCTMRNSKAPNGTACQSCRHQHRKCYRPKDIKNGSCEACVTSGHACIYTRGAVVQ